MASYELLFKQNTFAYAYKPQGSCSQAIFSRENFERRNVQQIFCLINIKISFRSLRCKILY